MQEFLANSFFRLFLVPIFSVALGIYVKHVTRNDQYAKFSKEDIAVGFDLMRAALLAYLILLSDKARGLILAGNSFSLAARNSAANPDELTRLQQVVAIRSQELMGGIFGVGFLMLGMWITSTIVRKRGWRSATELDPWYGISLPLAAGVAYLMVVMFAGS
jgi:hypothetical protein